MAIFNGSNADESIQPGNVSGTVFVSPPGSLPTAAVDLINGGGGNDVIDGAGGADLVNGGSGNDTITTYAALGGSYQGDQGNDTFLVRGLGLLDTVNGGGGIDTFDAQGAVNIFGATLQALENLALDSSLLSLGGSQLAAFQRIVKAGSDTTGNIALLTGGAAIIDVQGLTTLNLAGSGAADILTFVTTTAIKTGIAVNANAGNDVIVSADGNDTLNGGADNDALAGGAGNDSLNGGTGNDSLSGGADADTLDGGGGFDTLDGGDGDDVIIVRIGGASVFQGNLGNDLFSVASAGPGDLVDGFLGIDTLDAQGAVNLLGLTILGVENLALDGDNLLLTHGQLDQFTRIVASGNAATGVMTLLGTGTASIEVTELATLDVTGSAGIDLLTFTTAGPVTTDIRLSAGDGNDFIILGGGDDSADGGTGADNILGGDGDDTLLGFSGDDVLNGGAGNDSLNGQGNADILLGGDGDDTLVASGSAGDSLSGGNDNDLLLITAQLGGAFNGDAGNDRFEVSSLGLLDTIDGGADIDTFAAQGAINILGATILNVENLALDGDLLVLEATQLNGFTRIVSDGGATLGRMQLIAGGFAATEVTELAALEVQGSAGNDLLSFTSAATTAITVLAGSGLDVITTGSGNDSLVGGDGADILGGGAGSDTLDGSGGGADTLDGGADGDLIIVRAALGGSYGGGAGDDTFELVSVGLLDTIDGGADTDTLVVSSLASLFGATIQNMETLALSVDGVSLTGLQLNSFETVTGVAGATSTQLQIAGIGPAAVDVVGLETLTVFGSNSADILAFTTSGTPTDILVQGGDGADNIITGDGDDTLEGGDANDILTGNAGNDSLLGGDGADLLFGGADADTLDGGGGGFDSLSGGAGDDQITVRLAAGASYAGEEGNDLFLVLGATIGDTISGGLGIDTFDAQGVVSAFGATITGVENLALDLDTLTIGSTPFGDFVRVVASGGATQGNIQLLGAGGGTVDVQQLQTLVVTADGADQVLTFTTSTATKTNLVVTAAGGNDIVTGGAGADTLDGGSGNDLLIGEGGTDNLSGGGGDDGLVGGNGRDRLNGGSGNDVLTGGAGKDVLEGGIGADTFRWFVASEGGDRIRDFVTGGDKLAFSAGGFGGQLVAGLPLDPGQLVVHASNASTSAAGVGQFIFNTNTNTLRWDVDGGGLAGSVVIAELTGVAQIFATDFVVFA